MRTGRLWIAFAFVAGTLCGALGYRWLGPLAVPQHAKERGDNEQPVPNPPETPPSGSTDANQTLAVVPIRNAMPAAQPLSPNARAPGRGSGMTPDNSLARDQLTRDLALEPPFAAESEWPERSPRLSDESAREAWWARRTAERLRNAERMRSNLVERARLDPWQTTRFDVLVAAMNLRLRRHAEELRAALERGELNPHEARARAMKEIGSAVALTYDELDRNMPPGWRAATTNDPIDLWSFVEPDVWRELRALRGRSGRGGTDPTRGGREATSASGR